MLKYPNKKLKELSIEVPIEEISKKNIHVIKLWAEYVRHKKPQGMSCIQIGYAKQICVIRINKEYHLVFNPKILKTIGTKKSLEGCESVKGYYFVKRPLLAKITYIDINQKEVTKWYRYKYARIFCHEIDHLNGLCLPDVGEKWLGNGVYEKYFKKG